MLNPARVRLLLSVAVLAGACASAFGAQMLPPPAQTPPVPIPETLALNPAPTPEQPLAPALQPARRAQVELNGSLLSVAADNSSLNQILREIGRLTGMKITGGVTDERVYGSYGPAETSAVLTTLLGGTGSNMLLIEDDRRAPQELVLTPRQGGPTPPNPSASRDAGEERNIDLPPQLAPRYGRPGMMGIPRRPSPSEAAPPPTTPETTPPGQAVPTPPPTDTTTQESPNGVKTPQQIYDQLLRMQQQQQRKPPL